MTYTELKTELRAFQAQGYSIPALNSKKAVLEAALAEILASLEVPEVAEVVETPEVVVAPETATVAAPAPDTTPNAPTPRPVTGWQLAKLELTDDLRFVGTVLVWAIALIRSLCRFTAPHLKRGAGIALRVAVYAAVLAQVWLLPKLVIIAYQIGIWGVTIALRIVRYTPNRTLTT